jgi:hypothetical protein
VKRILAPQQQIWCGHEKPGWNVESFLVILDSG